MSVLINPVKKVLHLKFVSVHSCVYAERQMFHFSAESFCKKKKKNLSTIVW